MDGIYLTFNNTTISLKSSKKSFNSSYLASNSFLEKSSEKYSSDRFNSSIFKLNNHRVSKLINSQLLIMASQHYLKLNSILFN